MARKVSSSIAAGTTITQDVVTGGSEFLTIIGVIGPTATASGDVVITLQPYLDNPDGSDQSQTLADVLVPALESGAAVLTNNKAQQIVRYRVAGEHRSRTRRHARRLAHGQRRAAEDGLGLWRVRQVAPVLLDALPARRHAASRARAVVRGLPLADRGREGHKADR
jgi:hypothetical protein